MHHIAAREVPTYFEVESRVPHPLLPLLTTHHLLLFTVTFPYHVLVQISKVYQNINQYYIVVI